jgi:hypothetical protein
MEFSKEETNSIHREVENLFKNDKYYKENLTDFTYDYISKNVNNQDFNIAYMIAVDNIF